MGECVRIRAFCANHLDLELSAVADVVDLPHECAVPEVHRPQALAAQLVVARGQRNGGKSREEKQVTKKKKKKKKDARRL